MCLVILFDNRRKQPIPRGGNQISRLFCHIVPSSECLKDGDFALVGKWLMELLCVAVTFCLALTEHFSQGEKEKTVGGLKVLGGR